MKKHEFQELVRNQILSIQEAGPVAASVIERIFAAAEEYAWGLAAANAFSNDEVILPEAALARIHEIRADLVPLVKERA